MLTWTAYRDIEPTWPIQGRHILATWDESSVVVYQAYRPSIGLYAAKHGYFGGEFSLGRMSWVKPNFLWMMYRSGWGTKEGQEITLAVRIQRAAFDAILAAAVASSWDRQRYAERKDWEDAVAASDVRLQWDPDHAPSGAALERRAIQLGLRGSYLERYAREWILEVRDISDIVARERENVGGGALLVPSERVYPLPAHLDHVAHLANGS